ncbi:MAG: Ni/Fe hydrogenase subunit alpha [Firmicutes bacterium]|nr:Ni/Fe hydrogenase subunit alpha [Bacillota bacterium]
MAKIHLDHISRVEGHGALTVTLAEDRIQDVKLNLFEGMRGFESVVLGRSYAEVPAIIERICAICSAGHAVTAHMAVEKAMGIQVTQQTKLLRELAFMGMTIESHALHIFALALPDFLGYAGITDMSVDHPETVRLALEVKKTGNLVQEVVGGRAVHNVNMTIGGFGVLPSKEAVANLREKLSEALEAVDGVVDLLSGLSIPTYQGEPILFKAVKPAEGFGFFGDTVAFSDGTEFPVEAYKTSFHETRIEHSHAKQSTRGGEPFMVGALARINLFGHLLTGKAAEVLRTLSIPVPSTNAIYNNLAQVVELVYALERASAICDRLLTEGIQPEDPVGFEVRPGTGTVATEAPRGTLYHSFSLDEEGRVTAADVITPTALNQASAEKEIALVGKSHFSSGEDRLKELFEVTVRAYDPCISCSVHLIKADGSAKSTLQKKVIG